MADPRWEFSQKILGLAEGPVLDILPAGSLTAATALEVYQTSYQVRLVDSLKETYSAVSHCLGEATFRKLALEFLKKNPSQFYSLSHYGVGFGRFLRDHDNLKSFPFLSELAEFEWEFCILFHSSLEASEGFNLALIAGSEDFSIELVKHLRVFRGDYGIVNLWRGYTHSSQELPDWKTPQSLVLYRFGTDLRLREINLSEYFLLHFLMQSESLSAALEKVAGLGLTLTKASISDIFAFLTAEGLIKSGSPKCIAK